MDVKGKYGLYLLLGIILTVIAIFGVNQLTGNVLLSVDLEGDSNSTILLVSSGLLILLAILIYYLRK